MLNSSNGKQDLARQFEAIRFASYAEDPISSILTRFSKMTDREKEALVVALMFEMITAKKRLSLMTGAAA